MTDDIKKSHKKKSKKNHHADLNEVDNTIHFNEDLHEEIKKSHKKKSKKNRRADSDEVDNTQFKELIHDEIQKPNKKKLKRDHHADSNEVDNTTQFDEKLIHDEITKTNKKKSKKNHSEVTDEVDNTTQFDSKFIQRPSYFHENQYSSFDKYDSKREIKRSRYPDLQEDVVLKNKPRHYTISIALPASILEETCLAHVLRTYVIGQLARSACIYSIDEIIVYNDNCWGDDSANSDKYMGMMKMVLEYQECPQYLRKDLFPKHHFMKDVGVLNALNAPHHLLAYQWCDYREGVVLSKYSGKFSFVDIGLKSDVQIDKKLEPGLRVTVRLPPETKTMNKLYGYVVSPEEPRTKAGIYWGYTVRMAHSLAEVFKSDRFKDGYDLVIGTSDKGTNVDDVAFQKFSHALIVFGGVRGLEAAQEADESLSNSSLSNLFQHYVNVCPNQTSRTIRTEEAVLITLSTLCPKLTVKGNTKSR